MLEAYRTKEKRLEARKKDAKLLLVRIAEFVVVLIADEMRMMRREEWLLRRDVTTHYIAGHALATSPPSLP